MGGTFQDQFLLGLMSGAIKPGQSAGSPQPTPTRAQKIDDISSDYLSDNPGDTVGAAREVQNFMAGNRPGQQQAIQSPQTAGGAPFTNSRVMPDGSLRSYNPAIDGPAPGMMAGGKGDANPLMLMNPNGSPPRAAIAAAAPAQPQSSGTADVPMPPPRPAGIGDTPLPPSRPVGIGDTPLPPSRPPGIGTPAAPLVAPAQAPGAPAPATPPSVTTAPTQQEGQVALKSLNEGRPQPLPPARVSPDAAYAGGSSTISPDAAYAAGQRGAGHRALMNRGVGQRTSDDFLDQPGAKGKFAGLASDISTAGMPPGTSTGTAGGVVPQSGSSRPGVSTPSGTGSATTPSSEKPAVRGKTGTNQPVQNVMDAIRSSGGTSETQKLMLGIYAGESGHNPNIYDKKVDATEASYGPFQMNMRGGLGAKMLKETGIDARDPSTVPQQAKYIAGLLNKDPSVVNQFYGYRDRGKRMVEQGWGSGAITPTGSTTTGGMGGGGGGGATSSSTPEHPGPRPKFSDYLAKHMGQINQGGQQAGGQQKPMQQAGGIDVPDTDTPKIEVPQSAPPPENVFLQKRQQEDADKAQKFAMAKTLSEMLDAAG